MPLFDSTGAQYSDQSAQQMSQEIKADPWYREALQHRAAIQARGGQWNPEDYEFFHVRPEKMTQEWKDKYLNNLGTLAAANTPTGKNTPGLSANYQIDNEGNVKQRKSFVDHWYGKLAVLAPMIAGGGITAASAFGGGGAAAAGTPEIGGGGEALTTGLGGAGAVGPGGVAGGEAAAGAGAAATGAEEAAQTGSVLGDEFGGYSGAGEGTAGTGTGGGWQDFMKSPGGKDLIQAGTGALGLVLGGGLKDPYKAPLEGIRKEEAFSADTARNILAQGQELTIPTSQYLRALISGDRTALMQATQPERRKVIDQYSTAKRSLAEFAPRGGGMSSAMANLEQNQAADLSGITAGARANAVKTGADLGIGLGNQGLASERTAVGAMGEELNALGAQQRQKGDTGKAWGQIASGVLTGIGML